MATLNSVLIVIHTAIIYTKKWHFAVTNTTSAIVAARHLYPADIAQLVEREFSKLKVSSSVSLT